jgi:hypothetical protein
MYSCDQCGYSTEYKSNYTRHIRRKTGCGPKIKATNVDIEDTNVDIRGDMADTNVSIAGVADTNVSMKDTNVSMKDTNVERGYIVVTAQDPLLKTRVKCLKCEREMSKKHFAKHIATRCKGVPQNTCKICRKQFQSRSVLSRHLKMCRAKHQNNEDSSDLLAITNTGQLANNINNNITNNNNSHNNTVNNHICIRFGNENLDYIKEMREIDERVDMVIRCLSDVVDYVYFNADHPENQTVRKTNKKTDLIETRLNADEWEQDESHVVIRKIKETLEKAMNVEYDMMKPSSFKEFLYTKTSRGPKSEETILGKYDGPPIQAEPEHMRAFLKEVDSTCTMYRSACPKKAEFMEQANSVREYILFQAKYHNVMNFTMRNAESMYQAQLEKYSD